MKTARLIITFACNKTCRNCVNTHASIMSQARKLGSKEELLQYDEVCITGGEPLLMPGRVQDLCKFLRGEKPEILIHMYSAEFTDAGNVTKILSVIDGICYSLHEEATDKDVDRFLDMQELAAAYAQRKSFRLFIDDRVSKDFHISAGIWRRIEKKPFIAEGDCKLPSNETLLIWKDASKEWKT